MMMLTGFLKYNDSDYSFVFDEKMNELQLIPITKEPTVTSSVNIILNGITLGSGALDMKEQFLIGSVNENHKRVVFITIQCAAIKQVNNVLYIRLYAYFLLNSSKTDVIDKMTLCSPEIDKIFNVNRAFNLSYNDIDDFNKKGIITISTNDFDSTSSQVQIFKVEDREISVSFQITRTISTTIGKPPLSLSSCLCFEFEATDDYSFLINLCHYARNFIRFLCFRKNIYFTTINVYTPVEDNKHLNIGEICIFEDKNESEQEPFKTNRCIKYE